MVHDSELIFELNRLANSYVMFDAVYWFHLGRSFPPQVGFEDGILPLGEAIDGIWDSLHPLVTHFSATQWSEFRQGMEHDFPDQIAGVHDYCLKVSESFHWGPFGYLGLEVAIQDHRATRVFTRYWDQSEVIENICNCFLEKEGIDLLRLFKESTQPLIVKFISHRWNDTYLERAIRFLYLAHIHQPDSSLLGACFDGEGKRVAPEDIVERRFIKLDE